MRVKLSAWMMFFILLQAIPALLYAQNRYCGTDDLQQSYFKSHPEAQASYIYSHNNATENFNNKLNSLSGQKIVIPVVVHILYHTSEENISDEQIKSQIDILNEDYRAINVTTLDVPQVWKHFIHDSNIRFHLAEQDPSGNFSTGITRTYTDSISFAYDSDSTIYFDFKGGVSAWPHNEYLNIWVCSLKNNVLGFAALPNASPAYRDGIVINNVTFGRKGTVKSPYDFGRTCTHEIGHWFGLRHIWGDDSGACDADTTHGDGIADTPDQGDSHFRCPGFPALDNCSNISSGVMFMNYMDYTDDKCMMFFTPGQTNVMNKTLDNERILIKASDGISLVAVMNDVEIDSVLSPVTLTSSRCFIPVIRLFNKGNSTVKNIPVRYSINGGLQKLFIYKDSIMPGSRSTVSLPLISGISGDNILEVRIDVTDSNPVNNYYSSGFRINTLTEPNCESGGLIISPNPVAGLISVCVKTNFPESQESTIKIFNAIGQQMYSANFNINPGDAFSVPLQNMSTGVYFLKIEGTRTETIKFIFLPEKNNGLGSSICN